MKEPDVCSQTHELQSWVHIVLCVQNHETNFEQKSDYVRSQVGQEDATLRLIVNLHFSNQVCRTWSHEVCPLTHELQRWFIGFV